MGPGAIGAIAAMLPFEEEAIEGSGVDDNDDDAEMVLFASPGIIKDDGGGVCDRSIALAGPGASSTASGDGAAGDATCSATWVGGGGTG